MEFAISYTFLCSIVTTCPDIKGPLKMHSEQPVKVTYVDEVTSEEAVGDIEISHLRLIILISLSAATCSQRSRLDASRLSSTLSTTLYMIYDSSNGTHLLEWVNIQTLGT